MAQWKLEQGPARSQSSSQTTAGSMDGRWMNVHQLLFEAILCINDQHYLESKIVKIVGALMSFRYTLALKNLLFPCILHRPSLGIPKWISMHTELGFLLSIIFKRSRTCTGDANWELAYMGPFRVGWCGLNRVAWGWIDVRNMPFGAILAYHKSRITASSNPIWSVPLVW